MENGFLWKKAYLFGDISCFLREECVPERAEDRTGPDAACEARKGRAAGLTGGGLTLFPPMAVTRKHGRGTRAPLKVGSFLAVSAEPSSLLGSLRVLEVAPCAVR